LYRNKEDFNLIFLKPSKLAIEKMESGNYPDTKILDIRISDAKRGIVLHGSKYIFILHHTYMIELGIDKNNPRAANEKYTLFSNDKNKSYYQELTIKDYLISNNKKLIIEFIDLKPKLNYTLKVDSGDDEPYFIFENIPFDDLMKEME
jgi:hypothetical protein